MASDLLKGTCWVVSGEVMEGEHTLTFDLVSAPYSTAASQTCSSRTSSQTPTTPPSPSSPSSPTGEEDEEDDTGGY